MVLPRIGLSGDDGSRGSALPSFRFSLLDADVRRACGPACGWRTGHRNVPVTQLQLQSRVVRGRDASGVSGPWGEPLRNMSVATGPLNTRLKLTRPTRSFSKRQ